MGMGNSRDSGVRWAGYGSGYQVFGQHFERFRDEFIDRLIFLGLCCIVWVPDHAVLPHRLFNRVGSYLDV